MGWLISHDGEWQVGESPASALGVETVWEVGSVLVPFL